MSKLPTFVDSDLAERALTLDLVVREEEDDDEEDERDDDDDDDDDQPAGSDGYSE